ncbi:MAG: Ig-like domain-containing protein [Myxococcales bacterium]|nr:Ig-like domain-containing protein [Myxococcales bacterium]
METRGFTWAVADDGVATIAADGTLSADAPGATTVTAALGDIVSEAVALRVDEVPMAAGWRVRVSSQATGGPIAGAVVRAGMELAETDADGVAELPADAGGPLSVFAEGHDYVTLVGVEPGAVHVPLAPRSDFGRVAGFTGEIDWARVMSQGGVELGLAGASIGGGLTNLALTDLIGQLFNVEVSVAGFGFDVPLPGGLTFAAELPIVGQITLKDDFKVTARPGFQLGWAFAGRIDTNAIIGLFGGGGGGGFGAGQVLATVLPFFDQFQHGLRVAEALVALPRLPDRDDIDRDGDTEELQPDYSRFPVLNNQPEQDQRLRMAVNVPPLPAGDGSPVALLFAGVEVESVGFVPLGVSSADAAEAVNMRMAAPYQGLEAGEPVVVAIAARFGGGNVLPDDISVLMRRYPDGLLPPDVNLGQAFLPGPQDLSWEPAERALGATPVDAADAHRATFAGPPAPGRCTSPPAPTPPLAVPPSRTATATCCRHPGAPGRPAPRGRHL